MKKNVFELYYQKIADLKAAFDTAADEATRNEIRASYQKLSAEISEKGQAFSRVMRDYERALDRGNEYVDFNDVIWDRDVSALISCMRENGVEKFTFSSGMSSAVETAWLFTQAGCRLEGLVEINGLEDIYGSREKVHGYLFSL